METCDKIVSQCHFQCMHELRDCDKSLIYALQHCVSWWEAVMISVNAACSYTPLIF